MPYPLHRLGKLLFPGISLLLLAAHPASAAFDDADAPFAVAATAAAAHVAPARIFFHSTVGAPHILGISALYYIDTAQSYPAAGMVSRERNGNLVIAVPPTLLGRYKIRFFDESHYFLFEIKQIRDARLIVEKNNFQHAGLFQYELYRDNTLIERSSFLIRRD
jgi:hypothetical protein